MTFFPPPIADDARRENNHIFFVNFTIDHDFPELVSVNIWYWHKNILERVEIPPKL
jgi:hypothetical protein